MFRDSDNSKMKKSNFGVGSTVIAGNDRFVVVRTGDVKVSLLCLKTFVVLTPSIDVYDPNFLTSTEARMLVDQTAGNKLNYTYTDFDLVAAGIKP